MTAMREVPTPRRGSGEVTCCGGHRDRCRFGQMHSWSTWYENGKLQRTADTFHCHVCDGVCTGDEEETVSTYPEHDKLATVADQTQAIGEFVEWLEGKGIFLARYVDGYNFPRTVHGFRDLLAEWAGIDQNKLEAEKRQMLAVCAANNAKVG